ncbi:GNAT family N-acetyltransferase [Caulobacter hibisci]|uniref:GNAT family N-acetyltransferase n=1 Tax=Caulobacter hibisci TaxID=2035993 RepID=A0ABS0T0Z2_9CAUL|nr:GNAT family N-acetyltransferase [Caulobacter hibisci]MBI1685538.1 GNAT family N-acetyltransferase [Caulobacter hibisci]
MTIASFAPEHAQAVGALIVSIQREEFGLPITLADQPDLADIPGFYQAYGGFWVAEEDGAVVGSIGLRRFAPKDGALRKMFVDKAFRGRDLGVAAGLVETLLAFARTEGFERIWLGTTTAFQAAHRFYDKQGFTRVTADDLPPGFPRMALDTIFYRLDLASEPTKA